MTVAATHCPTALDFAIRFIAENADQDGEVPVADVDTAAQAAGHSWIALKKAATRSPRIATRKAGRTWVWRLIAESEAEGAS